MQLPAGFVLLNEQSIPQEKKPLPGVKKTTTPEAIANFVGSSIVGAADAASFGFGDELTAALGSIAPALLTDKTLEQAYEQNLERNRQQIEAMRERNPAGFLTGQVAGSLATGAAALGTKGGAAIANSLRSGKVLGYNLGLAGRAGKASALGAAASGAAGAGAGEGVENRLGSSLDSALAGGAIGGAIPIVGSVAGRVVQKATGAKQIIGKGISARDTEELDNALNAIKLRSSAAYKEMRNAGAIINKPRAVNITNKIEQALRADGKLNTNLHANTLSVLDDFKNAARQGDFTLEDLDQWRQLFGQVAGNFNDPINARKASIAIETIDDAVDSLKGIDIKGGSTKAIDALNYGRQEWARARKFERVANVIKKSDGDANYLKREFNKMITDPRKSRGLNDAEKAALKEAGTLNTSEAIMKTLGRFGFDVGNSRIGSGVGALVGGGITGAAAGTGAGIAAPVIGTAAKYGQKLTARGKAENLLSTIEGIQQKQTSGLPALISSPRSGQLAAPAGAVIGGQSPTRIEVNPNQPNPYRQEPPQFNLPEGFILKNVNPSNSSQPLAPQSSLQERIKNAESSGNPNAKNPRTSASGLYQFTDDTWRSVVDKWGRRSGIKYSDKNNPQAQEQMMAALLQDNARILQNKGIETTDGNLYFAHFMGAPAASKAIQMLGKNAIAARSFPEAARKNPEVFFEGQRPRTIDEVYQIITSKVV
jgi:hypothetical protein